ncbi:MAG: complex I NDUFA9 subunit family protein [Desulfuromonadales bacterium]|nr:complex I NDUFA9 subunit family protein [Desulfuromonadales bacterium]
MLVFVTGGTGFVGSYVLKKLAASGHQIIALVRPGSEDKLVKTDNITLHVGDVTDPDSLKGSMQGCDAVIHLVGIIREFPGKEITFERLHVEATRHMIDAATAHGVKRFLHMSANGARKDCDSDYFKTKWQAEEILRTTDLDWTIFRPTLIFGKGGEFIETLVKLVRDLPIVPVVGDGEYRLQPVAVEQVAETYCKALAMAETVGQAYHLGGSDSYDFNTILDLIGKAAGKDDVTKIHQPVALTKPFVKILQGYEKFPMTTEQLDMLIQGNECNQQPWAETFEIKPTAFADGVKDAVSVEEQ